MHAEWSVVDWWQIIQSTLPVAGVLAGAAAVGFALGRLIRGRPYIGRHQSDTRT